MIRIFFLKLQSEPRKTAPNTEVIYPKFEILLSEWNRCFSSEHFFAIESNTSHKNSAWSRHLFEQPFPLTLILLTKHGCRYTFRFGLISYVPLKFYLIWKILLNFMNKSDIIIILSKSEICHWCMNYTCTPSVSKYLSPFSLFLY
jgi:hypothetical protein